MRKGGLVPVVVRANAMLVRLHLSRLGRVCLLVLVSACAHETLARNQFAIDVACPADRVTVTARAGDPGPSGPLPADVAADPARLTMWSRAEADRRAAIASETYYEATGCGQRRVYWCSYGRRTGSNYCHESVR
jgi:hypothetical protein